MESSSRVDGLRVCCLPDHVPGNARVSGNPTSSPIENGDYYLISQMLNGRSDSKKGFHGRVHPHRSKFQYLLLLTDQVEESRKILTNSQDDLKGWLDVQIYSESLASIPGAEWKARVQRLLADASHLISGFDELEKRQHRLHSMVWPPSCVIRSNQGA